jgi:hypothetical protein
VTDDDPRAAEFLSDYRSAFERFDARSVADRFVYPCSIVGDADPVDVRSVATHDEWVGQLEMLLDAYRRFGVRSARVLDSATTSLTPRILQVAVHWSLRDAADQEVYDFRALYMLVEEDGALRIAAIAHDELPKIMRLLSSSS